MTVEKRPALVHNDALEFRVFQVEQAMRHLPVMGREVDDGLWGRIASFASSGKNV
jgi:hypothetical protein